MKIGFVFVTCRPETILDVITAYVDNAIQFKQKFDIILMEDSLEEPREKLIREIKYLAVNNMDTKAFYYTHASAKEDLGEDAYIFPHKAGACRGYGLLKAYEMGYDVILTIDDDVWPIDGENFVGKHLRALNGKGDGCWWNPFKNIIGLEKYYSRGFPYNVRENSEVVLNQGIQLHGADVDSITLQECNAESGIFPHVGNCTYIPHGVIIPNGSYTTIAYTSVAIKRKAMPVYYSQLMNTEVDGKMIGRFDDIWSGVFLQRIARHFDCCVSHAPPMSDHRKIPRPLQKDIDAEAPGIKLNEDMWKIADECQFISRSWIDCYEELAHFVASKAVSFDYPDYIRKNCEAMLVWCKLIRERE